MFGLIIQWLFIRNPYISTHQVFQWTFASKAGLSLGEYTAIVAAGVRQGHGGAGGADGCELIEGIPEKKEATIMMYILFSQTPWEKTYAYETPGS